MTEKEKIIVDRCRKMARYRGFNPDKKVKSDFCRFHFQYSDLVVDGRYGKGSGVRCKWTFEIDK